MAAATVAEITRLNGMFARMHRNMARGVVARQSAVASVVVPGSFVQFTLGPGYQYPVLTLVPPLVYVSRLWFAYTYTPVRRRELVFRCASARCDLRLLYCLW